MRRRTYVRSLSALVGLTGVGAASAQQEYPTWDASATYSEGDRVVYEGTIYEAQWWTQGDEPGSTQWGPWNVVDSSDGGSDGGSDDGSDDGTDDGTDGGEETDYPAWDAGTTYTGGDRVVYEGTIYEAQWWTRGDEPDAGGPWDEVGPVDGGGGDDGSGDDGSGDSDGDTGTPGAIPENVFAPFVDVALDDQQALTDAVSNAGTKYFTLAFVNSAGGEPAWAGDSNLIVGESGERLDMQGQIADLRADHDGEVIVSFGGLSGTYLAEAVTSASTLKEKYATVVDRLDAQFIDFDEEQHIRDNPEVIERRNEALALLQAEYPELSISYTLPVMPSGLPEQSSNDVLFVLEDAAQRGVELDAVNLMTMNYGSAFELNGETVVDAAESVHGQLADIYPDRSATERWNTIGLTPMIGQNDVDSNVFYPADAQTVLDFAQEKNLRWLSFWELVRDNGEGSALYESSQIDQEPYEFSSIFDAFTSDS
ncbi:lysozyme [Halomicrobium mukohataei]|uniref:Lysozyme n=1 Tax=Halomicrobium mukohataei TaxID=57705 RepID=A0A847UFD6_9EURY|nr:carbohydrate-binding protein [Halomicrobium mukohataei]NLV09798.1 lysozyme [Halomicrobium mukohataei]